MSLALISVIVILFLTGYWYVVLLRATFIRMYKFTRQHKLQRGKRVEGTIVEYSDFGKSGSRPHRVKINVEFPNFVGTPIREEFTFIDTKPLKARYGVGKTIRLELLEGDSGKPVRMAEGSAKISTWFILLSIILNAAYLYGVYTLFNRIYEKSGGSADGLEGIFNSEEAVYGGLIMIGVMGFNLIIFRAVGLLKSNKSKNNASRLKYYGKKAIASITRYEDTGTMINDNPLVRFYFNFTDENGHTHESSAKQVVNKLDVALVPNMKEKEIMYMPDNPSVAAFSDKLKSGLAGGCAGFIFYFVFFIFTCVILGQFLFALWW